jgi:20S proteasome alpha/beta subunit
MTISDLIISDSFRKVVKAEGMIGGFVGDAEHVAELMRWFKEGADLENIPKNKGSGIVVFDQTVKKKKAVRIVQIEEGGYFEVPDHYYARGSGREVALGAMYMGASAVDAVDASISLINTTGGHIFVEELWD